MENHAQTGCPRLDALLRRMADEAQAAPLDRVIDEHLATCPVCAAADTAVVAVIARYCRTEQPPLPAALEQRLLDQLCKPRQ